MECHFSSWCWYQRTAMWVEKKAFPSLLRVSGAQVAYESKTPSDPCIWVLGKEKSTRFDFLSPFAPYHVFHLHSDQRQILEGLCFPQMSRVVGLLSKISHASEIKLKTKAHLVLPEGDYGIHCHCKRHQKHIPNPLIPLKSSAENPEWRVHLSLKIIVDSLHALCDPLGQLPETKNANMGCVY